MRKLLPLLGPVQRAVVVDRAASHAFGQQMFAQAPVLCRGVVDRPLADEQQHLVTCELVHRVELPLCAGTQHLHPETVSRRERGRRAPGELGSGDPCPFDLFLFAYHQDTECQIRWRWMVPAWDVWRDGHQPELDEFDSRRGTTSASAPECSRSSSTVDPGCSSTTS